VLLSRRKRCEQNAFEYEFRQEA